MEVESHSVEKQTHSEVAEVSLHIRSSQALMWRCVGWSSSKLFFLMLWLLAAIILNTFWHIIAFFVFWVGDIFWSSTTSAKTQSWPRQFLPFSTTGLANIGSGGWWGLYLYTGTAWWMLCVAALSMLTDERATLAGGNLRALSVTIAQPMFCPLMVNCVSHCGLTQY